MIHEMILKKKNELTQHHKQILQRVLTKDGILVDSPLIKKMS